MELIKSHIAKAAKRGGKKTFANFVKADSATVLSTVMEGHLDPDKVPLDEWGKASLASKWNFGRLGRYTGVGMKDYYAGLGADWLGGLTSTDMAVEVGQAGYPEGRDAVARLVSDAQGDPALNALEVPNVRRKRRFRDEGDTFDHERFYAGRDDYWESHKRDARGVAPVVSIVYGWGGVQTKTAEQLLWAGAAAFTAAEILSEAGYSVEVAAMNLSRHTIYGKPDSHIGAIMQLKSPDQPITSGAIATGCHAGIFRTMGFMLKLCNDLPVDDCMGSTMDPRNHFAPGGRATDDERAALSSVLEGERVVIMPTAYNRHAAIQAVKDAVADAVGVGVAM